MKVYKLDNELWFPDPRLCETDEVVAIGGELSTDRLLLAYSNGYFPYFAYKLDKTPEWHCPLTRFVIFPEEIHVSHSMRQLINKGLYEVTINKDFMGVINGCCKVDGRNRELGAWLSPDIIKAYTELHKQGYAASVEVWKKDNNVDKLVGGLYGVVIGNAFMGESMFSLEPNTSKLALITLALFLRENGGVLIDCQYETSHLKSMGGRHISYDKYMELLNS